MAIRAKGFKVSEVKLSMNGQIWANAMPSTMVINGEEFNNLYNKQFMCDDAVMSVDTHDALIDVMTNVCIQAELPLIEAQEGRKLTDAEYDETKQDIRDKIELACKEAYEATLEEAPSEELVATK